MTIQQVHYDFKLKYDKNDSSQSANLKDWEIDWIVSEAQLLYAKRHYGLSNPKRIGFEGNQKRIDDLSSLQIKSPSDLQPGIVPTKHANFYEVPLSSFAYNYLHLTRLTCSLSKEGCGTKTGVIVKQVEHDDLSEILKSPFEGPSFEWQVVPVVFGKSTSGSGSSLFLYYSDFEIDAVYPEYLKFPNRTWIGTYDLTDDLQPKTASNNYIYQLGTDSPVTFELPEHTHNEIVDLAVLEASLITTNPEYLNMKTLKVAANE